MEAKHALGDDTHALLKLFALFIRRKKKEWVVLEECEQLAAILPSVSTANVCSKVGGVPLSVWTEVLPQVIVPVRGLLAACKCVVRGVKDARDRLPGDLDLVSDPRPDAFT
jgi:hypothetical protein